MTAEEMIAKAAEILAREAGPHAKVILFGSLGEALRLAAISTSW
jgi:hypothetical protein